MSYCGWGSAGGGPMSCCGRGSAKLGGAWAGAVGLRKGRGNTVVGGATPARGRPESAQRLGAPHPSDSIFLSRSRSVGPGASALWLRNSFSSPGPLALTSGLGGTCGWEQHRAHLRRSPRGLGGAHQGRNSGRLGLEGVPQGCHFSHLSVPTSARCPRHQGADLVGQESQGRAGKLPSILRFLPGQPSCLFDLLELLSKLHVQRAASSQQTL